MSFEEKIKHIKHLYDERIVYDESKLPQELKEYISELKKYDQKKDWLSYDLKFDEFEIKPTPFGFRHWVKVELIIFLQFVKNILTNICFVYYNYIVSSYYILYLDKLRKPSVCQKKFSRDGAARIYACGDCRLRSLRNKKPIG